MQLKIGAMAPPAVQVSRFPNDVVAPVHWICSHPSWRTSQQQAGIMEAVSLPNTSSSVQESDLDAALFHKVL